VIPLDDYPLLDPDAIATPAMLVYRDALQHNIDELCALVGGDNLVVHVKTHKSAEVTRLQLAAGISGVKAATLTELAMALDAGAERAVLAYPLLQPSKIDRFVALSAAFPNAAVYAVVSRPLHLERLSAGARRGGRRVRALLDVDVGMSRTGIGLALGASDLYGALAADAWVEAGGLHAYDGHEHERDPERRAQLAHGHIAEVQRFRDHAERQGWPLDLIVAGGTFSFRYYAVSEGMLGSPGTTAYWDARSSDLLPDLPFRWAAFVLTQVIDLYPEQNRFTTDLGSKAIAADPPLAQRALLPALPEATMVGQSEEHGVFESPGALPELGSYLLAVPGHVCPTIIRYPHSLWIDRNGRVSGINEHTARDRA
jgi:D-serine deaminase-like pyridoxal phosphate-dependent protein